METVTDGAQMVALFKKQLGVETLLLPDLEWLADTIRKVNVWLTRGDGIAVYTNMVMGHPDLGDMKFMSYGSSEATLNMSELPKTLPDWPGQINWRYQLTHVYVGGLLEMSR